MTIKVMAVTPHQQKHCTPAELAKLARVPMTAREKAQREKDHAEHLANEKLHELARLAAEYPPAQEQLSALWKVIHVVAISGIEFPADVIALARKVVAIDKKIADLPPAAAPAPALLPAPKKLKTKQPPTS
jgi:hypothetical protein